MKSYLIFRAENRHFAINSSYVREATFCSDYSQLPFAKKHVVGMCNLRGDIYPVLYPWKMEQDGDCAQGRQILVQVGKTNFLLRVAEILDSQHVEDEFIENNQAPQEAKMYHGRFKSNVGLVEILSPENLLKNL